MAELDIKDIWKKSSGSLAGDDVLNVDEVIGKKSKTVLDKIAFILKIEFWINCFCSPLAAYIYYTEYGFWTGTTMIFFGAVYFFYYLFLLRAIKKFDFSGEVKSSLTKVYKYLKFYLLHYKVVVWISFVGLFWLSLGYGYYLGATGQTSPFLEEDAIQYEFNKEQVYWVLGLMIAVPVLIASVIHYLINLIYGVKIKKLKLIIKDFKDD